MLILRCAPLRVPYDRITLRTLSAQRARPATHLTLTQRLATAVFPDEAIGDYCLDADGAVGVQPLYRVPFSTTAWLYYRIELRVRLPTNDFGIYATPVTHVNDAEAKLVRRLCSI